MVNNTKSLVLQYIRNAFNDEIVKGKISIDIKHGINIIVHKDYAQDVKLKLEQLLDDQVILAYYEIHQYASDYLRYRCIYTIAG
ncbi:MAG: hypothetical protein QXO37_09515 [Candidatus Nitrosocaldaceae archaeon]